MRRRKSKYRVTHKGQTLEIMARTPGNAVWQFRRATQAQLRTDHETGGWIDVQIEVAK